MGRAGGLLLLVVALGLRAAWLGEPGLWMDEGVTWELARGGPGEVLARQAAIGEVNPPLYNWLAALAWGLEPDARGLRWPSALAGVATVWLLLGWDRARLPAAGLAALLVACSARNLADSQEARAYALLAALGLLWVRAVEGWIERGGGARLLGLVAIQVAAFHTHLMSVTLLLAFNLWLLCRARSVLGPGWRGRLGAWLGGQALFTLACVPWLLRLGQAPSYPHRPGLAAALDGVYQICVSHTLPSPLWALASLAVAGCALAAWGVAGRGWRSELWWVYLFGPWGFAALISWVHPEGGIFLPRYFSFLVPAFAAGCASAVWRAWRRGGGARWIGGAILAAALAANLQAWRAARLDPVWQRQDWRGVAARLALLAAPGDRVLVQPGMASAALRFHLEERRAEAPALGALHLTPINLPPPTLLEGLSSGPERVWLAFLPAHPLARASGLDRALSGRLHLEEVWQNRVASPFDLVVLLGYRPGPPARPQTPSPPDVGGVRAPAPGGAQGAPGGSQVGSARAAP